MSVSAAASSPIPSTIENRASTSVNSGRIPELDGIRGIAIALVLAGHSLTYWGETNPLLKAWSILVGEGGVAIFFALSGFLVTRVMLLDEERTGRMRLGRFYIRRALRIFPAFYVFLSALALLSWTSFVPRIAGSVWAASAFYFRNVFPRYEEWNTGHLWSLSLEEQFYLFWPVFFVILGGRRRRLQFIAITVFAATVWRLYWLSSLPSPLGGGAIRAIHYWPQMRLDTFLVGAAFAIGNFAWPRRLQPLAILPFAIIWHMGAIFSRFTLALDACVTAFIVSALISWCLQNPLARSVVYLRSKPLVWLGVISYSVYLWQQPFLGIKLYWWSPIAIACCAMGSYYWVERPMLKLKTDT